MGVATNTLLGRLGVVRQGGVPRIDRDRVTQGPTGWSGTAVGLLVLATAVIPGGSPGNLVQRASTAPEGVLAAGKDAARGTTVGKQDGASGWIGGHVYGLDGRAAAGASVRLAGSGVWPALVQETAADGSFSWPDVPPGTYEVSATQGELASPAYAGLSLDADDRKVIALRLVQGGVVVGRVLDSRDDRPLHGARVTLAQHDLGATPRSTQTGPDGRFSLLAMPDETYALYIEHEGFVAMGPIVETGPIDELEVRLTPAAILHGAVIDESGAPVQGALVQILGTSTGTRARGAPRWGADAADSLGVTLGPVPPITAAGAVTPVVGETKSDRRGSFMLTGLAEGTVRVVASHRDSAPSDAREVRLVAGETTAGVHLALRRGGTIRGRVVDASGAAAAAVPVSVAVPREAYPRVVLTDSNGSFAFRGVLGEVRVTARALRQAPVSQSVRVAAGDAREVKLVIAVIADTTIGPQVGAVGGGTVEGRVLDDWTFEPVAGASVVARRKGEVVRRTQTGSQGTFELGGLPMGTYNVTVDHPDFGAQRVEAALVKNRYGPSAVEVGPFRLLPGGSFKGVVRDNLGDPVGNAEVTWGGVPNWDYAVRTGSDGRYTLRGIPRGTHTVHARHKSAGIAELPYIVAHPKDTTPGVDLTLDGRL